MTTNITTINGSDLITNSRDVINNNFSSLNTNKIETSVIDTDNTLGGVSASDLKLATQKAVKDYADSLVAPTGKSWNEYAEANSGTDSYTISVPGLSAYVAGQTFKFKADVANTGACTLNVNGLGAKTITKRSNADLDTNDILANQIVEVIYDGSSMQFGGQTASQVSVSKIKTTSDRSVGTTEDAIIWDSVVYSDAGTLLGTSTNVIINASTSHTSSATLPNTLSYCTVGQRFTTTGGFLRTMTFRGAGNTVTTTNVTVEVRRVSDNSVVTTCSTGFIDSSPSVRTLSALYNVYLSPGDYYVVWKQLTTGGQGTLYTHGSSVAVNTNIVTVNATTGDYVADSTGDVAMYIEVDPRPVFVLPATGTYQFDYAIKSTTTATKTLKIAINGTEIASMNTANVAGGVQLSTLYKGTSGELLYPLVTYSASGGTDVLSGSTFSVTRLS